MKVKIFPSWKLQSTSHKRIDFWGKLPFNYWLQQRLSEQGMSTTARCILGKTLQTLIQQSHVKFSEDLAIPMPWKRPPLIWTKTCRNQTDGLLAVMRNKQIVKAWHHMIFTLPMRSFITLDALAAADGVGAAGSSWVCICVSPGISEKYEWWTCVKLQATLNVLVRYVCVCARHIFIDSIKFPLIQRISNTVLWLSLSSNHKKVAAFAASQK